MLPDQVEYLALGRNLLNGQGLSFFDQRFRDQVYAFRMPGYPLLVAALGADVRLVRLAQAAIDASTVLAIYLLARRWLSRPSSLFAAGLVAFNPFLIYFTGLLLTETLFTAMLAWGMFLLARGVGLRRIEDDSDGGDAGADSPPPTYGRRDVLVWLAGGAVLALSLHVRQSAAALPVLLGVVAAFLNRGRPPAYYRRWPLPVGTTMLLLTGLALLPWGYRNYRVLGTWVWTTTNGGITAYDGLNPDATGASDQSFVNDMPQLRAPRMNELERSQYLGRLARQFVRQQPWRSVELAGVKAARTWSPVPLSEEYRGWKYQVVGWLYTLPLYVLTLLGLWRGALPRAAKVFLLLPAVYFTAVHMLSVGSLRYRIPVEPPITIVAAALVEQAIIARRLPALEVGDWKRAGSHS